MKVLFLTITLGLITALQAQDPLFFPSENENIIGTWYVKAVVADKDLPKEKRPKKVFPLTVTALDGGDLEAMVTFMKGGQCHEKRVVMHQTEEPGRYSAHGGKRHVYILDLPVKDHHIFYCEGQLGGKAIRMAKLVGINPDMSLEALEEFKKFTERKGLPQDNIIMPVQTGQGAPGPHSSPRATPPGPSVLQDMEGAPAS
uniref:Lipocalin/cytosolic fatty-acid binding domain-containing protein n=1 Tax=Equus caballus TaxID=9796 RepID=A0A9L0RXA7_HORSE